MAIDPINIRLSEAFTPHRPIDLPKFLSGRVDLLYRAMDAANTEGLHVILFGDRGTGKTSISRVLGLMLQEANRVDGRRVLQTSCNSTDTYTSIWRRVFQEILVAPRQLGFSPDQSQIAVHRMQDFEGTEPNDVRLMVQALPNPSVIVIDEFDRVPHNDARRLMADTIKLFSDTGTKATIILVGVADSLAELFSEHQSISRNLEQIAVEPMAPTELGDIVRKGYDYVGLGYDDALPRLMAELSQGYPHYTHLLGLWAGRRALAEGASVVTSAILDSAIPDALKGATGGVQQEYERAILSSQKEALFEEVLLGCALARKDSLGRFATAEVRKPLSMILGREVSIGGYQSHLAKFTEPERGPVLKKSGKQRSYRWQFVNPQIIPYILIRGKERGISLSRPASLSSLPRNLGAALRTELLSAQLPALRSAELPARDPLRVLLLGHRLGPAVEDRVDGVHRRLRAPVRIGGHLRLLHRPLTIIDKPIKPTIPIIRNMLTTKSTANDCQASDGGGIVPSGPKRWLRRRSGGLTSRVSSAICLSMGRCLG